MSHGLELSQEDQSIHSQIDSVDWDSAGNWLIKGVGIRAVSLSIVSFLLLVLGEIVTDS